MIKPALVLLLGGLCLTAQAAAPSPAAAPASGAAPQVEQALALLSKGDTAQARQLFEAARKARPQDVGPVLGLAEIARLEGDALKAEDLLRTALTLQPDNVDALQANARLAIARHQGREAQQLLQKAIVRDPSRPALFLDLGEVQVNELKDLAAAEQSFRKAVELAPEHAGARFALGSVLMERGDAAAAEPLLEKAVALAPENALAHGALSQCRFRLKKWAGAEESATRALERTPKWASPFAWRGQARAAQGKASAALEDFTQARQLEPALPAPQMQLAMAHQLAGQLTEATQAYARVLQQEPRNALAANNQAWLLAGSRRDLDEALRLAQLAVAAKPGETAYLDTLARVHEARGDKAAAVEALKKATAAQPSSAYLHYRLGAAYGRERRELALASLKRASELDPRGDEGDSARRLMAELATAR